MAASNELVTFLDSLEVRKQTDGCENFHAIPGCIPEERPVGTYSWVNPGDTHFEASEWISDDCVLRVSARNYGLYSYVLRFEIRSDSRAVQMLSANSQSPGNKYRDSLLLEVKPPIKKAGAPLCKGAKLILSQSHDVTCTFDCEFSLIHDGTVITEIPGRFAVSLEP